MITPLKEARKLLTRNSELSLSLREQEKFRIREETLEIMVILLFLNWAIGTHMFFIKLFHKPYGYFVSTQYLISIFYKSPTLFKGRQGMHLPSLQQNDGQGIGGR